MSLDFYNKWTPIFMDRFMNDFGGTVEDAAAVFGNAGHESEGYKSLQEKKPVVPGSRGGYGIMQWTGPRRREYEAYCKRNELNPSDMDANYAFLFVELKGWEGRVLPKLFATKGLKAKTKLFSDVFLRPGIPHMDSRYQWSNRAMAAYKNKAPATPKPVPTPAEPTPKEESFDLIKWLLDLFFGRK